MARGMGGESPSNVQHYLQGLAYPAGKRELIDHARRNGAPEAVRTLIEALDAEEFDGPQDVMNAYGRLH